MAFALNRRPPVEAGGRNAAFGHQGEEASEIFAKILGGGEF